MFHTRFLSTTDQKCAESSTYWQFFYYRQPGKFWSYRRVHWDRLLKCYTKNSTDDIFIHIYIWSSWSSIWIFYITSTWDWLHHFTLFMKCFKKMFLKLSKVGRSGDWLAKWIIMLRLIDLRWPMFFRRSNVGLVEMCLSYLIRIRKNPNWSPVKATRWHTL